MQTPSNAFAFVFNGKSGSSLEMHFDCRPATSITTEIFSGVALFLFTIFVLGVFIRASDRTYLDWANFVVFVSP